LRIERPREVARGEPVEIVVDGQLLRAFRGESVAAALLASGRRTIRLSAVRGEPRGLFCGIGVCQECLMVIDGIPNRRACMTPVETGMNVQTQTGRGSPSIPDGR
jgi:D-hydroxyproline dehydrogenase subunit gamma